MKNPTWLEEYGITSAPLLDALREAQSLNGLILVAGGSSDPVQTFSRDLEHWYLTEDLNSNADRVRLFGDITSSSDLHECMEIANRSLVIGRVHSANAASAVHYLKSVCEWPTDELIKKVILSISLITMSGSLQCESVGLMQDVSIASLLVKNEPELTRLTKALELLGVTNKTPTHVIHSFLFNIYSLAKLNGDDGLAEVCKTQMKEIQQISKQSTCMGRPTRSLFIYGQ